VKHAFIGALLAATSAACGGAAPSAVNVCKKNCTRTVGCTGGTTTQVMQCQTACDTTGSQQLAGCTNANDILSCLDVCLDQPNCNALASCESGCPKCVRSTGGIDPVTLCNQTCDKLAMCSPGAITASGCKTQADCAHASGSTCLNADSIVACVDNCNKNVQCPDYTTCLQSCPACQQ
jgi:hypothetical protein